MPINKAAMKQFVAAFLRIYKLREDTFSRLLKQGPEPIGHDSISTVIIMSIMCPVILAEMGRIDAMLFKVFKHIECFHPLFLQLPHDLVTIH